MHRESRRDSRSRLWMAVALALLLALAACGGGDNDEAAEDASSSEPAAAANQAAVAEVAGDPEHGKELFVPTCGACHGPEGKGVENLGKDMTSSEFIAERTDAELLEFIKVGRAPDHPLNTTGVLMPPKGGNPALSDEDILDIIAYIHTLQE